MKQKKKKKKDTLATCMKWASICIWDTCYQDDHSFCSQIPALWRDNCLHCRGDTWDRKPISLGKYHTYYRSLIHKLHIHLDEEKEPRPVMYQQEPLNPFQCVKERVLRKREMTIYLYIKRKGKDLDIDCVVMCIHET